LLITDTEVKKGHQATKDCGYGELRNKVQKMMK